MDQIALYIGAVTATGVSAWLGKSCYDDTKTFKYLKSLPIRKASEINDGEYAIVHDKIDGEEVVSPDFPKDINLMAISEKKYEVRMAEEIERRNKYDDEGRVKGSSEHKFFRKQLIPMGSRDV